MKQSNLIKSLRVERGYSQKKLCEGISSRTTLSSFENRGTELSSELLFCYLDRLNIKLEEYQNLLNDGCQSDKKRLSLEFSKQYYEGRISEELKAEILKKYESTNDFYFFALWFEANIVLEFRNDTFSKGKYLNEIKKLCDYLFEIESWQHFEISLFTNLMFVFSDEMILTLFNSSQKIILMNTKNPYYRTLMTTFFINGVFLGFERNNEDIIQKFLTGLNKIALQQKDIYARIHYTYFNELFLLTSDPNHLEQLSKLFDCLKFLGLEDKEQELKKFYLKVISEKNYESILLD